jgi:phospholipase C
MSTTSIHRRAPAYCPVLVVAAVLGGGVATSALADQVFATEAAKTATPIKHVVVVIGENRSFDHVYATYVPQAGQAVLNLLSEGIVQADGLPGPNFAAARQFTTTAHNHYFVGVGEARKTPYNTLPPPTLGGAPNAQSATLPPFFDNLLPLLALVEPSLEPTDLPLLTTGATGAAVTSGAPDTRITNYAALPNGPFQLTGPTLRYDSYTGDTVHQFYQMWQQSDCRIQNATEDNPTGCLSDLYPFVATTFAGPQADEGGGTSMAFYNMQTGDAPLLKSLADEYTLSDNHHQPAQGAAPFSTFLSEAATISSGATAMAIRPCHRHHKSPTPIRNREPITSTRLMGATAIAPTLPSPVYCPSFATSIPCRMRQAPTALSAITTC